MKIKKSITIDAKISNDIQSLADKNRRSYSSMIEVMAVAYLEGLKKK